MPRDIQQYANLLRAALEEEIGIYIETDKPATLQSTLYDARKLEPEFADLAIVQPTIDGRAGVVFIAKKATEMVE